MDPASSGQCLQMRATLPRSPLVPNLMSAKGFAPATAQVSLVSTAVNENVLVEHPVVGHDLLSQGSISWMLEVRAEELVKVGVLSPTPSTANPIGPVASHLLLEFQKSSISVFK